jgi:hypothetical protein
VLDQRNGPLVVRTVASTNVSSFTRGSGSVARVFSVY